jgi:hypothetical protein
MIELIYDLLVVLGVVVSVGFIFALLHGEEGMWWFGTVFLLPVLVVIDIIRKRNSRK